MRLHVLCEKSGAPSLTESGLIAGRLAGRVVKFKTLKLVIGQNILFSALFSQARALFQQV